MTFLYYSIWFNVIGIVGSTLKWCGMDEGEEGEEGGEGEGDGDGDSCCFFFILCIILAILVIFIKVFNSMNEFGLFWNFQMLKHYVVI